ncbi:MAG TPA: SDR family NAD(P)-dependent oxidoreductase [Micromonosporaceae bacterium]
MLGRTALVTGANRGLGLAVAGQLASSGYQVVVAAREEADAVRAAVALGRNQARWVRLDVTDPDSVARACASVPEVDILVNNAGVLLDWQQAPTTVPLPLVQRELEVNVLGAWRMAQAYVPGMISRGWGRVVMVSSGTASFTNGLFPGAPGYALSKTALNALTVLLATETRGTGVLVNAVNPGLVRTRMRPDATRTPEEAAKDVVWAATLDDDGPTGAFLRSGQVISW